jgi:hypothetical protein
LQPSFVSKEPDRRTPDSELRHHRGIPAAWSIHHFSIRNGHTGRVCSGFGIALSPQGKERREALVDYLWLIGIVWVLIALALVVIILWTDSE